MKRIIAALCAFALLMSLAYAEVSGGFEYTVNDSGKAVITGYTRVKKETEIVIPAEIDGYAVTSIASKAVSSKKWLTKVTVSEGITSIGALAFRNNAALTEIVLPSTLTSVGNGVFRECPSLSKVSFSGSNGRVRMIAGALTDTKRGILVSLPAGMNVKNMYVLDGIKELAAYAFDGCAALETVTLPGTLETISARAFSGCASLKEIVIPDSVTILEGNAFVDCAALESVTVGEGVTSLEAGLFSGCAALKYVSLPAGLSDIDETAFDGCVDVVIEWREAPAAEPEAETVTETETEAETVTVTVTGPEPAAEPETPATRSAVIIKGSNVRAGAGTNYDKIGVFAEGTKVQVLEQSGEWYKVTDGKITGYVYNSCIALY